MTKKNNCQRNKMPVVGAARKERQGSGGDALVRFATAGFPVLGQVCYKNFHSVPAQAPRRVCLQKGCPK